MAYLCGMCEKEESQCECDIRRYCGICQGEDDIRLCEDGQYYCRTCRESCDYQAQY